MRAFSIARNLTFKICVGTFLIFLLHSATIRAEKQASQAFEAGELWEIAKQFRLPPPPKLDERTRSLAAWGARLFNDPGLSRNGAVACASCHQPEHFFTDARSLPVGLGPGLRHTPSLINSFASSWFFWDGRADSLAAQATAPLEHPMEHGLHRLAIVHAIWRNHRADYLQRFPPFSAELRNLLENHTGLARIDRSNVGRQSETGLNFQGSSFAAKRLLQVTEKSVSFQEAEMRAIDWSKRYQSLARHLQAEIDLIFARVGLSIAAFEKTIVSTDSPFDLFLDRWAGKGPPENYLNREFDQQALEGLRLFLGQAQCVLCHHGPYFSDGQFHHVGFPQDLPDPGRSEGIKKMLASPFACNSHFFQEDPSIAQSAACREREFLITDSPELVGAFKTPSLRHVAQTPPYGHAGQFASLKELLQHYNQPVNHSRVGQVEASLQNLNLNARQLDALEQFLKTLASEWRLIH